MFGTQFFRDYPYILPGMTTSALALSAAVVTLLFVNEVRLSLTQNSTACLRKTQTLDVQKIKSTSKDAPMTTWQLIKSPGVSRVLLIYNYIAFMAFSFTAVNSVFLYTPVELGGLGFQPELIAATIGLAGASQAVWLLLGFPALHKRVGTGQVLRYAAYSWPIYFAMHSGFNFLLRYGLEIPFWVLAPPALMIFSGVAMAFGATQLAVNDIAPSHETFGTLNAIVLALQSGIRAFAPALATSIYATGVKYRILGGQLFWLVIIVVALGLIGVLRLLPEKAEGRVRKASDGGA